MAEAASPTAAPTNPRPVSKQDLVNLYRDAYRQLGASPGRGAFLGRHQAHDARISSPPWVGRPPHRWEGGPHHWAMGALTLTGR